MKKDTKTSSKGTLSVCVLVLPGAKVGTKTAASNLTPDWVKREIAAANKIWKQKEKGKTEGVSFTIIMSLTFEENLDWEDINTEHLLMNQLYLDQNAQNFLGLAYTVCPTADVYILYMNGDNIGPVQHDGTRILAINYLDYPLIIMSNGAKGNDYILAHELGHFMFNANRFGNRSDPNPFKDDPAHNASPTNLMYPTGMNWPVPPKLPKITEEQIRKALETRFFY